MFDSRRALRGLNGWDATSPTSREGKMNVARASAQGKGVKRVWVALTYMSINRNAARRVYGTKGVSGLSPMSILCSDNEMLAHAL